MSTTRPTAAESPWINFDLHGMLGLRVHDEAPAARQLRTMFGGFVVDHDVPDDIVVTEQSELMVDAAELEDELVYGRSAVLFRRQGIQVARDGDRFRVHGSSELLTTVLPLVDVAMVARGAAMVHAATIAHEGRAVALPAGGGTGKTSTMAKLMKQPGFSFMGDDWGFLTQDGQMLNFEKPMFIKPHHRSIYPHLFNGSRKPLVPVRLSRPVGRFTSKVHPYVVKYPRVADMSRRLSPEHRIVTAQEALPGTKVTTAAPLALCVFVERYVGARTRLRERDHDWMVQRMLGNFHVEMHAFSRDVVAGLAATSNLSLPGFFAAKADLLSSALVDIPSYVLQVPSVYNPDLASDDIVGVVSELLTGLAPRRSAPVGVA